MLEDFLKYVSENEGELTKIYKKLGEKIHDEELEAVRKYAGDLMAYRAYATTCLANFNKFLDEATDEFLPAKEKNVSELDRKTKVEARVSAIRYWRNFCKGLVDTIDRRVSYAQSELSFAKEYAKKVGAEHV